MLLAVYEVIVVSLNLLGLPNKEVHVYISFISCTCKVNVFVFFQECKRLCVSSLAHQDKYLKTDNEQSMLYMLLMKVGGC